MEINPWVQSVVALFPAPASAGGGARVLWIPKGSGEVVEDCFH